MTCRWCAADGRQGCPDHRRERWVVRTAVTFAVLTIVGRAVLAATVVIALIILARA